MLKSLFSESKSKDWQNIPRDAPEDTTLFDPKLKEASNLINTYWIQAARSEITSIVAYSQRKMDGLNQLLEGSLSPSLVDPGVFMQSLAIASKDRDNQDVWLDNNNFAEAWRNKVDVYYDSKEMTFKATLLLPAQTTAETCGMARLMETPIQVSSYKL